MIMGRRGAQLLCMEILLVISVCISLQEVEARISGVYGDNGHDQTIIHHTLTTNDQREVEHEILELLGLPDRPRRNIHPTIRRAVPQFLLEVYKRSLAEDGAINSSGGRHTRSTSEDGDQLITALDKEVIDQSDIIMTFLNKNHRVADVRHERGSRVWFDTSEVSRDDVQLMMGELRLYQREVDVLNVSRHGGWSGHSHHLNVEKDGNVFTVSVYGVVSVEEESGEHRELEFLGAINTTSGHVGWLEMNITRTLSEWIADDGHNNHGLYISVRSALRPEHEIRLEELGLVARSTAEEEDDEQMQPFVVGFFKGQEFIHPTKSQQRAHHHRNRSKRQVVGGGGKRKKTAALSESQRHHPFFEQRPSGDAQSCQIQQLYVSFKDLKWHDWIIAPDGYGAYYCSGECNFPMNSHMNATNHAIIQTLVHLLHPLKVPKPCCAPTKLSAISVLYFIDDTNVMLKKYKNMVVKSCGCH